MPSFYYFLDATRVKIYIYVCVNKHTKKSQQAILYILRFSQWGNITKTQNDNLNIIVTNVILRKNQYY